MQSRRGVIAQPQRGVINQPRATPWDSMADAKASPEGAT